MSSIVLSTAYFPSIAWFQHLLNAEEVYLEACENYTKQSYRNRTQILSAQGVQALIIPVRHSGGKMNIKEVYSDESQLWKTKHWHAIQSAYGKSPFFMYYDYKFEPFFKSKESINLFAFNMDLTKLLLSCLKVDKNLILTDRFSVQTENKTDLRNAFIAKGSPQGSELLHHKSYLQGFPEKFDFKPNLSIIDLLFNQGPKAIDYLI